MLAAVPAGSALGAASSASLAIPGRSLFTLDWESGDRSQWSGCQTRHAGGITVGGVRRQGRRAARFEVTDRDFDGYGDRSECQKGTGEREGVTRWYSWSTLLPKGLPADNARAWAVITQWHCTCSGSPPVGFYLQSDRLELSVHRSDHEGDHSHSDSCPWGGPRASVKVRWIDIRMRVRWSASDARGFIDLWVNGRRQRMNWPRGDRRASAHGGVGAVRARIRTLVPGGSGAYLKQGLYRSPRISGRAVVYHDAMRITAG